MANVRSFVCYAALLAITISVAPVTSADPPSQAVAPALRDFASSLADIEASVHVEQSDQKELSKIGSDFSVTYSLRTMSLLYKQPDKIRLEGKSPTRGNALMILNGAMRFVDIPRFKIHITENLEKSPSRRQSLLELGGVMSPNTLSFMSGTYLRSETVEGHAASVFDVRYNGTGTSQRYRIWFDTANHTTLKREWYGSDSQLKATFLYDQAKEVTTGAWLPTRVQVKNADGIVAAVLTMEDIRVNQGLGDDLFFDHLVSDSLTRPIDGGINAVEAQNGTRAISADPRWNYAAVSVILITSCLRIAQLGTMRLAPDEAYYWDWSRRLAAGYYDQGPFIAYLIRATTSIFGSTEFGVRIGVLLSSAGTLAVAYVMARRYFSNLAGFITVLLLSLAPLMEVGSIIATYDPPLVFFWTVTVALLERALFAKHSQSRWWLAAGLAAGFGLLSKHTMLVVIPCLVLFLAFAPASRHWLMRPEAYMAVAIIVLMYGGVIWWNAQHHWWTFGHLLFLTHNRGASSNHLRGVGDYIASQVALVGPALFAAISLKSTSVLTWRHSPDIRIACAEEAGQADTISRERFLFCMGWPVFFLFLIYAFKAKVQGNWAACAWVTPVILFAGHLAANADRSIANYRRAMRTAITVSAVGLLVTLVMVFPALAYRAGLKLKPDADLTNQTIGWKDVAARVDEVRKEMTHPRQQAPFIIGSGYQYPALLAFYLPDHPYTSDMFLHFRLDMYAAYIENLRAKLGQDAVFVNENKAEDADLRRVFTDVTWDPPLEIYRKPYYTDPIRTVYIARCRGYRLYTGWSWHVGG